MKKSIVSLVLFLLLTNKAISASDPDINIQTSTKKEKIEFEDLKYQIRDDFAVFLQELYNERKRGKNESDRITTEMNQILKDSKILIDESRDELRKIAYTQDKNLLIASIFLWISITIFIIMNLVFAHNLKKELYFLRNGLLRSEIKDNMIILAEQLDILSKKIESINKKG
ncbi:MAG: hypothetical protein PHY80_00790 [Rickettsiales bacterium]|nr:hypothetical protein [Rickettsiales bacterium]